MFHFNDTIMLHSNHYVFAALVGLAAIFSSCSIKEDFDTCNKSQVQLDVRAFGIEQSAFTKAGGGKDPHRIVFKAFDALGAVAYETTQASGQEDFGVLDFELSPGSYTFVAVAHDLSSAALAADEGGSVAASINSAQEAVLPEADVADCFCDTLNVTIKPGVPFASGMTLPRVISKFKLTINDALPAGTAKIKFILNSSAAAASGNPSFDPSTGFALKDRQYVRSFDIGDGSIGKSGVSLSVSLLLTAETQDIDVTAAAYDAEGNLIISHELEDVPMKLNRTTVAKGNFFSATGGGSFSFSTDWGADEEISY